MAHDRPLTLEQMRRLLDDIEGIPQQPVGPHLDAEDLIGFAKQSLSTSRRAAVFEHIRSCAQCAQDVLNTPHILAEAATGRQRAVEKRQSRERQPARAEADPRLRRLAWFVVTAAVLVAARRVPIRARAAFRARGTADWKESTAGGFECAIGRSGNARIVAVRTTDRRWTAKPIRCVIKGAGDAAVDVWLIIPAKSADEAPYTGTALLPAGITTPSEWTAEVEVFESFSRLPGDALDVLRRAIVEAGGEAERGTWRTWSDQQVREGEVTTDLVNEGINRLARTPAGLRLLTPQERSILKLIAQGKTTKEMALEMGIAAKTVDAHRYNIRRKLQIDGRQALAKFATRHRRDD